MANAKPKQYYAGGWVEPFKLTDSQRVQIVNWGAKESDIPFIESTMSRYLSLKNNREPTSAEILASLEQGEKAIDALMNWLHEVDDLTLDHIESAARENHIEIRGFKDYWNELRTLDIAIEMGRRDVPPKSRGRRETLDEVHLAMLFLNHWKDREVARNVLSKVLPDVPDVSAESQKKIISRLLASAAKRLNKY